MSTLVGINLELAAAVRRMNSIHDRIPPDQRPDLSGESWRDLEAELDRATHAGDLNAAMTAIRRWEIHISHVLAAVLSGQQTERSIR